jgi:hypothetical protein
MDIPFRDAAYIVGANAMDKSNLPGQLLTAQKKMIKGPDLGRGRI